MPKKKPSEEPYNPVAARLRGTVANVLDHNPLTATQAPAPAPPAEEPARPVVPAETPEPPAESARVVHMPSREKPPAAAGESLRTFTPPETNLHIRTLKTRVKEEDEKDLERYLTEVSDALGVKVKKASLMRALLSLALHAEAHTLKRARKTPRMSQPSSHDHAALARIEFELAKSILGALRDSPPFKG